MAKFEESRPHHEVHHVAMPRGHGMMDQKLHKGMRSPIVSSIPSSEQGAESQGPAGAPGQPFGEYAGGDNTGS